MKEKKKYPLKCRTKRCRGFVATKDCHSPYCAKCKMRQWNERNPLARAFHNLRTHAKERGKDFSLTIDQFRAFAEKTDYMKRKGKTSLSLTVERVNDREGYHNWNISAITLRENSRKSFVPYFRNYMERELASTQHEVQALMNDGLI